MIAVRFKRGFMLPDSAQHDADGIHQGNGEQPERCNRCNGALLTL